MGQSLSKLYIHLTFSTKGRYPFLKEDVRKRLHEYMNGILRNLDSPALSINSVSDHVHILFCLSKNHALAGVVEELKKVSSKWLKNQDETLDKFSWQTGYAAFSVTSSKLEAVRTYISNQEEHHRYKSYKEEVDEFMKQYGMVEYDIQYYWNN